MFLGKLLKPKIEELPALPPPRVPLRRETVFTDRLLFNEGHSEVTTVLISETAPDKWRVDIEFDASKYQNPFSFQLATAGLTKERAYMAAKAVADGLFTNNQMVREQCDENRLLMRIE